MPTYKIGDKVQITTVPNTRPMIGIMNGYCGKVVTISRVLYDLPPHSYEVEECPRFSWGPKTITGYATRIRRG